MVHRVHTSASMMTNLDHETCKLVDGGGVKDFCLSIKIPEVGEFWIGCWG